MQLNTLKRDFESRLPGEVSSAKIEANAKAFQILSSNLYQDKPRAIIRELCANALDSHKAANKLDVPFKVVLPSRLRSDLHIRDFGVGLSHDGVMDLYMTYFGSSKTMTNELIGGLGLGSKTPYAYTDTFSVISHYGGKKRTYTAFKNEEGLPQIALLKEEDTSECNGLEIIVPVKESDIITFHAKAQKVLEYFPKDSFEIEGRSTVITPVKYAQEYERFAIRKLEGWYGSNEQRVVMGPIAYSLEWSMLPTDFESKYRGIKNVSGLDIFAEIGDIDIQASREALSYDKLSVKKLGELLDDIQAYMVTNAQKVIDDAPTTLEKLYAAQDIHETWRVKDMSKIVDDLNKQFNFKIDAKTGNPGDMQLFGHVGNWSRNKPTVSWRSNTSYSMFSSNRETRTSNPIVFIEIDEINAPYVQMLVQNKEYFYKYKTIVYRQGVKVYNGLDAKGERLNKMTFREFIEKHTPYKGNIIKYSELDAPARKKGKRASLAAKEPGALLVQEPFTGYDGTKHAFRERQFEDINKLDAKKYIWAEVSNRNINLKPQNEPCATHRDIHLAHTFGLFNNKKFIGVPRAEKRLDKICRARFDHVATYTNKELKKLFAMSEFKEMQQLAQTRHNTVIKLTVSKYNNLFQFIRANYHEFQYVTNMQSLKDSAFVKYIKSFFDTETRYNLLREVLHTKVGFPKELNVDNFYSQISSLKPQPKKDPRYDLVSNKELEDYFNNHTLNKDFKKWLDTYPWIKYECNGSKYPRLEMNKSTLVHLIKLEMDCNKRGTKS